MGWPKGLIPQMLRVFLHQLRQTSCKQPLRLIWTNLNRLGASDETAGSLRQEMNTPWAMYTRLHGSMQSWSGSVRCWTYPRGSASTTTRWFQAGTNRIRFRDIRCIAVSSVALELREKSWSEYFWCDRNNGVMKTSTIAGSITGVDLRGSPSYRWMSAWLNFTGFHSVPFVDKLR